jgi:hypothetical protein
MGNRPVYDIDPKYEPLKTIVQYSHLYGWPSPPDPAYHQHVHHPEHVRPVVTNVSSPKDAIRWAETEIRKIVDKA